MPQDPSGNDSLSKQMSVPHDRGFRVERSIIIRRSPQDLFEFWHNFEHLPRFMNHVKAVTVQGPTRSHWVVKGPAGRDIEWDAEIINDVPFKVIGWRSLDGAVVPNAGSVRFEPLSSGNGTEVRVELKYMPPAGALGALIASLYGENPEQQLDDDLKRFKDVMETAQASSGARK